MWTYAYEDGRKKRTGKTFVWNKRDRPVICLFCHDRHLKLLFPGLWQKICFSRSTPRCDAILKSRIYKIHRDVWERVLNYSTSREPVQGQSRTSVEPREGKLPCIGETKGTLCERFKEHRQATNNPLHANTTAAVPSHFNQPGHSISAMDLIPLELQHTLSMARLKAREAYLIDRGKTLSPDVLNRRNEHWTVSISIV